MVLSTCRLPSVSCTYKLWGLFKLAGLSCFVRGRNKSNWGEGKKKTKDISVKGQRLNECASQAFMLLRCFLVVVQGQDLTMFCIYYFALAFSGTRRGEKIKEEGKMGSGGGGVK